MKSDLIKARTHFAKGRALVRRHFLKHRWPVFYEDIDYLIRAIDDCLDTLKQGHRLPL